MSEHINTDPLAQQVLTEKETTQAVKELSDWVTASAKNATFRVVGSVEDQQWSKGGRNGNRRGKEQKRKRNVSSRTKGRMRAVDVVYEAIIKRLDHDAQQLRQLIQERQVVTPAPSPMTDFSIGLLNGLAEHLFEIDMIIEQFSRAWSLDRMPPIDLAILRLGVWEIKYCDSVDDRVVVDEMVKIAALISTDDSPSFVNALLDRISKTDLKANAVAMTASAGLLMEDDLDLSGMVEEAEGNVATGASVPVKESGLSDGSAVFQAEAASGSLEVQSAEATFIDAAEAEVASVPTPVVPVEQSPVTVKEEVGAVEQENTTEAEAPVVHPTDRMPVVETSTTANQIAFDEEALDEDVAALVSKLLEK